MKRCPNCSNITSNSCKFCDNCGASMRDVPEIQGGMNDFADKAGSILSEQMKKIGTAITVGVEKAKESIEVGREKLLDKKQAGNVPPSYTPYTQTDAPYAKSQPGGGWDQSVNPNDATSVEVVTYPFFKDEDETTLAVLGEEAATSDLNGNYRMPYAVLTQKHLYCKNEAGNFVVDTSDICSVTDTRYRYGWTFILAMIFPVFLVCIVVIEHQYSGMFGGVFWLVFPYVLVCAAACYFYYRKNLEKAVISLIAVILFPAVVFLLGVL